MAEENLPHAEDPPTWSFGAIAVDSDSMELTEKPKLDTLPEEIISIIVQKNAPLEILKLRQVCKALEHSTFHDFSTQFFSRLSVLLTYGGLERLSEICQHPRIANLVRELRISIALFSDPLAEDEDEDDDEEYFGKIADEHLEAYKRFALEQQYLLTVELDSEIRSTVAAALKSLPNCHGLEIHRLPTGLGMMAFEKTAGSFFKKCDSSERMQELLTGLLPLLWRAVAKSGASITEFSMGLDNTRGDGAAIEPKVLNCPERSLPQLRVAIGNLKKLMLNIDLDTPNLRLYRSSFHKYIACAEQLEVLGLDFGMSNGSDEVDHLFRPPEDLTPITYPAVKEIFLSNVDTIENDTLRDFLRLFAGSLERLHFNAVTLQSPWDGDIQFFRNKLHLKHLCMMHCSDEQDSGILLARRSAAEQPEPCKCPHPISYDGTEMQMVEYLNTLPDRVVHVETALHWAGGFSDLEGDDDDDEENDDDEWEDDDEDDDLPDLESQSDPDDE